MFMNFNYLIKNKGWRNVRTSFDRGIEKIRHDGSRLHLHNEKEKHPHIDLYAPSISPLKHLVYDYILGYLLARKNAPVLREWTQRYEMINSKRMLVAIRINKRKIEKKIIK